LDCIWNLCNFTQEWKQSSSCNGRNDGRDKYYHKCFSKGLSDNLQSTSSHHFPDSYFLTFTYCLRSRKVNKIDGSHKEYKNPDQSQCINCCFSDHFTADRIKPVVKMDIFHWLKEK